jgi:hypothetical protein
LSPARTDQLAARNRFKYSEGAQALLAPFLGGQCKFVQFRPGLAPGRTVFGEQRQKLLAVRGRNQVTTTAGITRIRSEGALLTSLGMDFTVANQPSTVV